MRMLVIMLVSMIMLVIVRIRYVGPLLRGLICVCHLSRGQIHAFQETSGSTARRTPCGASAATPHSLLYEASVERVKPRAVLSALRQPPHSPDNHPCSHYGSRKMPESFELKENICSRICHCIDCPGCSTAIPVSSSFAHSCPNGSS